MQRSMKISLVLLWGIFCWCPSVTMITQTPESNTHTTDEPQKSTQQQLINPNVQNKTQTHPTLTPAGADVATQETEKAIVTHSASDDRTSDLTATEKAAAATTESSGGRLLHSSAASTKETNNTKNVEHVTVDKQSSTTSTPSANISGNATPTSNQPHQQSATTSTNKATPSAATPAASLATTAPKIEPTSTTKLEVTTKLPPTNSSVDFTQTPFATHNRSSPSASSKATLTENTTSGTAPTTADKATTGTLAPSSPPTNETVSTSTSERRTTGRSNTEPPTTNTTDNATSPAGVLIPKDSKTLPPPTTKSLKTTTKSPPGTDPQHCSTRHLVKQSLIAIASLAALATIFMVSTIVLCTKLSSRKYRMRRTQQDTEMMCISSLLPERNYNYSRQRNPPSNGVLVMHTAGDSDEEGGDNLTLSSFLPDNDRSV